MVKRSLNRKPKKEERKTKSFYDRYSVAAQHDEKSSEIARQLGISRQAVSQALKRGLRKFYRGVQEMDRSWTPFQVVMVMARMLQQDGSIKELKALIGLLPSDVRDIVVEDAMKRVPLFSE
jgi:IS30 family transposase